MVKEEEFSRPAHGRPHSCHWLYSGLHHGRLLFSDNNNMPTAVQISATISLDIQKSNRDREQFFLAATIVAT